MSATVHRSSLSPARRRKATSGSSRRPRVRAQVELKLAPAEAVRLPRSVLTFSTEGQLSVRTVGSDGIVASVPVTIIEDGGDQIWVAGPDGGARIIVQGQDFVKDGQRVEAVAAVGLQ